MIALTFRKLTKMTYVYRRCALLECRTCGIEIPSCQEWCLKCSRELGVTLKKKIINGVPQVIEVLPT